MQMRSGSPRRASDSGSSSYPAQYWSSLPDELLELIHCRLCVTGYVRFGAVCRKWNCIFAERRHPPASEQPWLWYPFREDNLYCLSEKRSYRHLHLPVEFKEWRCYGSQHGWLIFLPPLEKQIVVPLLVNPLTGAQVRLPKFVHVRCPFQKFYWSLPPDDPRCIVIYIDCYRGLSICSPNSYWKCLNDTSGRLWYVSSIRYKGSLYAITFQGELHLIDFDSLDADAQPTFQTVIPAPQMGLDSPFALLLECQGELQMYAFNLQSSFFKIYRANFVHLEWENGEILGDKLITSDYWTDFMPIRKEQINSTLKRLVEYGTEKYSYHCCQPYAEIMFSPRL